MTRRLLTTDTDDGADVVEVAHEAFLSAWPPLATMIADNATALRARRRIEQAAADWADQRTAGTAVVDRRSARRGPGRYRRPTRHRPPTENDASRRAAVRTQIDGRWRLRRHRGLVTDHVALTASAREFLHASIRRDRFLRWRITVGLATLLVLALVATGIAVVQLGVAASNNSDG